MSNETLVDSTCPLLLPQESGDPDDTELGFTVLNVTHVALTVLPKTSTIECSPNMRIVRQIAIA